MAGDGSLSMIILKRVKTKFNMATVKVFLSFEYDRDVELRNNFYARSERSDSCHNIENYSLDEQYKPHNEWLQKAQGLISRSDIVIVVLGDDTHNAPGVKEEVKLAKKEPKPIFQIRSKNRTVGEVECAGDVVPWDWHKIDECLNK